MRRHRDTFFVFRCDRQRGAMLGKASTAPEADALAERLSKELGLTVDYGRVGIEIDPLFKRKPRQEKGPAV